MMKFIKPVLPEADQVVGEIYPPDDPACLTDGMLHVKCGPYNIDVSWYPEHDPNGRYMVTVYEARWEDRPVPPVYTRDQEEAAQAVRSFVARFAARGATTQRTGT